MPQFIFLLLLVAAGWLLYRRFVTDAQKVTQRGEDRRREERTGAQGTLVEDPETGEYRPKKDDE